MPLFPSPFNSTDVSDNRRCHSCTSSETRPPNQEASHEFPVSPARCLSLVWAYVGQLPHVSCVWGYARVSGRGLRAGLAVPTDEDIE
jgi:hypothetical protein